MDTGVSQVTNAELARLAADFAASGWRLLEIPAGVHDARSFFEAIRVSMPLDPPIASGYALKWDGLSDSLFGGLNGLHEPQLAIIWRDGGAMEVASPDDFRDAFEVLNDVSVSLGNSKVTAGATKQVIVLIGRP